MPAVASGIIILWPGTVASIPTGWSRETSLDGRYPRGAPASTNPGGTGGALTHSHTTTGHVHTTAHTHTVPNTTGSAGSSTRDTGTTNPPAAHTHASNPATVDPSTTLASDTPSTDTINHEPAYFEVLFLRSDGTPQGFPSLSLAVWNNVSGAPSGWGLCDGAAGRPDLRGRFLKGAATSGNGGGTGGAATHTHALASHAHGGTFAHVHPAGVSSQRSEALVAGDISGTAALVATATHTHALTFGSTSPVVTGQTDTAQSANHEPPAWVLAYVQNISGALNFPDRMIALWTGTLASIPANWALCDGTLGTPDLRSLFVKGATVFGDIGTSQGGLTHSHTAAGHTHAVASHTHTVTAAVGASENRSAGATATPTDTHTHTWPITGGTALTSATAAPVVTAFTTTQPPYTDVVFLQWQLPTPGRYDFMTATATVLGTTHALGTSTLLVQAYTASGNQMTPTRLTIHPTSHDVVATFAQAQVGYLVISGGPGTPFAQTFSATQNVTVLASSHGFLTSALLVEVYDAASPSAQRIQPNSITINQSTYDVTVTFGQNQSGTVLVCGAVVTASPPLASYTLSGTTTTTIAGTTHGLGTAALLLQVWDGGTPAGLITPASLLVHSTSYDVAITFAQNQAGTVVFGTAAAGAHATLSLTQTAQTITAAGVVPLVGTASIAQIAQTSSAAGALSLQASAATLAQAGQTSTILGQLAAQGTAPALVQAAQTITAAGVLRLLAAASITQATQASSSAGVIAIGGAAPALAQASHLLASGGTLPLVATGVAPGTPATTAAAGALALVASASATQAAHTSISTALFNIQAAAAPAQAAQALLGLAATGLQGAVTVTAGGQILASTGLALIQGATGHTQTAQATTAVGTLPLVASVAVTTGVHGLTADGTVASTGHIGDAAIVQSAQGQTITGKLSLIATLTVPQVAQTTTAVGVLPLAGAATPSQAIQSILSTIATGGTATVAVSQGSQGLVARGAQESPHYSQAFSTTTHLTIPAIQHKCATAAMLVQVYDVLGGALTPDRITIDASTLAVDVWLTQGQPGLVVIGGSIATEPGHQNYVQAFPSGLSVTVPGTAHQFGTAALLVAVYDAGSPAAVIRPTSLVVNPTTFAVTATFAQNQAGTIVVSAYAARSAQPLVAVAFGPTQSVAVLPATHGFFAPAIITQVYDAATPRRLITPASLTWNSATFTMTATFAQNQTGTLIMSGALGNSGTLGATQTAQAVQSGGTLPLVATAVVAQAAQTVQSTNLADLPNYAESFTTTFEWRIPRPRHGITVAPFLVDVYDASSPPRRVEPNSVTIDASTSEVVLQFSDTHTGTVVLSAGRPLLSQHGHYRLPFTSSQLVQISGLQHHLPTANLLVQVYDASTPARQILPERLTVDPASYDVALTFVDAQAGTAIVGGYNAPSIVPLATKSFAGVSSVTVLGTEHATATTSLFVQVYDTSTPMRRVIPDRITVDPTSFNVVVTFLDNQSGTVVVSGAEQQPLTEVVVTQTSQTLQSTAKLAVGGTVNLAQPAQTVVASSRTPRLLYAQDFTTPALQWQVPGSLHGCNHPNLIVQFYNASTPRRQLFPDRVTVDPASYDVNVFFLDAQAGRLVIAGASVSAFSGLPPNIAFAFTSQTQIHLPQTSHGYSTSNLLVDVYDVSTPPRRVIPDQVTVGDAPLFEVVVSFVDSQSGFIVLSAAAAVDEASPHFVAPFSAAQIISVPQSQHGLQTRNLFVQAWDTSTPRRLLHPTTLTLEPGSFDVQLSFMDAQSGTVVINGSPGTQGGGVITIQNPQISSGVGALRLVATAGSLAAPDFLNSTGLLLLTGQVVRTQPAQTMVAAATLSLQATVAALQSAHVATSGATHPVQAATALTQGAQLLNAAATLPLNGAVAQGQASQTITANGVGLPGGTLLLTQAAHLLSSTGLLPLGSTALPVQAAQTSSGVAALALVASLSQPQGGQTSNATGRLALQASAPALSMASHALLSAARVPVQAAATLTQSVQVSNTVATVSLSGVVTQGQSAQMVSSAAVFSLNATVVSTQASQTVNAAAQGPGAQGNVSLTQGAQILQGAATLSIVAITTGIGQQPHVVVSLGGSTPGQANVVSTQATQAVVSVARLPLVAGTAASQTATLTAQAVVPTGAAATLIQSAHTLSSSSLLSHLGTLTVTQVPQVLGSSSRLTLTGALSQGQSSQALTATGIAPRQATLSQSQAAQSITASGSFILQGTLAQTQTLQAPLSVARLSLAATALITQAAAVLQAAGLRVFEGTTLVTQNAQALVSASTLPLSGTLSQSQAAQASAVAGVVTLVGTLSAAQGVQTVLAETSGPGLHGNVAVTQTAETLVATGRLAVQGSFTQTQGAQALTGASVVVLGAMVAVSQGSATSQATGTLRLTATVSDTQVAQASAAHAGMPLHGSVNASQDGATLRSQGTQKVPPPHTLTRVEYPTEIHYVTPNGVTVRIIQRPRFPRWQRYNRAPTK
jgi:hypothetical protein